MNPNKERICEGMKIGELEEQEAAEKLTRAERRYLERFRNKRKNRRKK